MREAIKKFRASLLVKKFIQWLTDKTHREEAVCEAKCEIRGVFRIARALAKQSALLSYFKECTSTTQVHPQSRIEVPMSISVSGAGYDSLISSLTTDNAKSKADAGAVLQSKLSSSRLQDATDEELMDVCKSFESYLLEKVLEKTKKTLTDSEEEDSPYMNMFGDKLYQEYANQITEHSDLGLAQQLYNAMKRDFGATRNDNTD